MTINSITRSSDRRPLRLLVKSRVQSRVVFVDLIDISEGGCKLLGGNGFAKVGDRIVIKVGEVNAPLGTVAWMEGRTAGEAFDGEMHSAVLDHLCASLNPPIKERLKASSAAN